VRILKFLKISRFDCRISTSQLLIFASLKSVASSEAVLIIEVSDSTARKDRLVKAKLYASAGIPEFWIVDLNSSETVVHRGPSEAGWADVVSVPFAGEVVAAFDGAVRIVLRSDLA
jgi:Putative restriction endonuclease